MQFPILNPRRPLDDEHPDGYAESDRDYVENNLDAAVWLLDNCAELSRQLYFWRKACDDAHNLGADRLVLATDTLIDVGDRIQGSVADGTYFDKLSAIEAIQSTLEKLA